MQNLITAFVHYLYKYPVQPPINFVLTEVSGLVASEKVYLFGSILFCCTLCTHTFATNSVTIWQSIQYSRI